MAQESGKTNQELPTAVDLEVEERTDPHIVLPIRPAAAPKQSPAPAAPAANIKMPDLGAIQPLMLDPAITEIMINDLRNVMIEKDGKMMFSGFKYQSIDEINRLTRTILDVTGRILSPEQPYVDVMLPDGSRVNIIGPPLTIEGPCVTIRKFPVKRYTIENLMNAGMLDRRMAYFLNACVVGRLNILICGGTGSGKTTFLNGLTYLIPKAERVVTIEDTPELAITHVNSVRLQTKPASPAGAPITARDLVANALRMRPDRIIVGECRRAEAFDMLQAMNTGHEGSLTTLHANSPRDGLARLETLCLMAGVELPLMAIRKQIVSALDLIVQIRRFRDGTRRVVSIAEVTGMEGEVVTMQDIFSFEGEGGGPAVAGSANPAASGVGRFKCTGFVPTFLDRLRAHGIELPANYFA